MKCDSCDRGNQVHPVVLRGHDIGCRLCCSCMDSLMVRLGEYLQVEGKATEATTGLARFRRDHRTTCGFTPAERST